MREKLSKILRVEDVPRKPIEEARVAMVTAKADFIQGEEKTLGKVVKTYGDYVEARMPPERQVVIFDSFRVSLSS